MPVKQEPPARRAEPQPRRPGSWARELPGASPGDHAPVFWINPQVYIFRNLFTCSLIFNILMSKKCISSRQAAELQCRPWAVSRGSAGSGTTWLPAPGSSSFHNQNTADIRNPTRLFYNPSQSIKAVHNLSDTTQSSLIKFGFSSKVFKINEAGTPRTATSEGEAGSARLSYTGRTARLGNTHNTHRAHGPNHPPAATKQ